MKKKFSRILGVGLTVALLASLMLVAAPASAATLKWTTETIPSSTGDSSLPVVDDSRHWCSADYCPDCQNQASSLIT